MDLILIGVLLVTIFYVGFIVGRQSAPDYDNEDDDFPFDTHIDRGDDGGIKN